MLRWNAKSNERNKKKLKLKVKAYPWVIKKMFSIDIENSSQNIIIKFIREATISYLLLEGYLFDEINLEYQKGKHLWV